MRKTRTSKAKPTTKKRVKHPGFEKVEEKIERRQGVSKKRAGSILSSRTRAASPAAKRRNPRLKKVKG